MSKQITVHIPRAIGGSQTWNYGLNGFPFGQVYTFTDAGCDHGFTAKPLRGIVNGHVERFETFADADKYMKGLMV